VFDVAILVEELKNDWVALQQLGLTEARIRDGFKAASPAVGFGAHFLGAPPWLAILLGAATYFASEPAGEEYVRTKFFEWRAKWARILANCSEKQLWELANALKAKYAFVYGSIMSTMGYLPPP